MQAPVHRLKKAEIVWLATHTCKAHRHSYLSHYSCYLKEGPETERLGFFDIETSNLVADFGVMLSYALKDGKSDKIYSSVLTPEDIKKAEFGSEDKRLITSCLSDLSNFDHIVTYYGCLTPDHRVLTVDLRWVAVGDLDVGDQLLAFKEAEEKFGRRCWATSEVVANPVLTQEVFEICLSDGTVLKATGNHPWLVQGLGSDNVTWVETCQLTKGTSFYRILDTWDTKNTWEGGWLAGIFDGEGTLNQSLCLGWGGELRRAHQVAMSQNEGTVAETVRTLMRVNGFECSSSPYDKNHPNMRRLEVVGGKAAKLKFLGSIRPCRLLEKFNPEFLGSIKIFNANHPTVVSVRSLGVQEIIGLGTTTGTYISEGFGSHNSRFDIPFVRARALSVGLDFPNYGSMKHTDLYFILRGRVALSSKRLENACRVLLGETNKTRIDAKYWRAGVRGDKKSLAYILDHNKKDVLDLQKLYDKMIHFARPTDTSI